MLELLPENSILTPHPKEFDRIAGESENSFRRNLRQIEFSSKNNVIVVLKGAYTSIALPNGCCYFNSTGNPGMSTAGSGDVLTGVILSLLAQGYQPSHAAMLGAYVHGLAGDLATVEHGQQALIASDIVDYLGNAFIKFENYDSSF
jgi:NAD(P)H-hydrate epimerase